MGWRVGVVVFAAVCTLIAKGVAQEASDPDSIELNTKSLIFELRNSADEWSEGLVWIGEPCIPILIDDLDQEEMNQEFVSQGSATLFMIGGERVEEWLRSVQDKYSVLKQRSVIRGATRVSKKVSGYERFCESPEAEVRLQALQLGADRLSFASIVELLGDPSEEVRLEAWKKVQRSARSVADYSELVSGLDRLVDHLDQAPEDLNRKILKGALEVFVHSGVLNSSEGRGVFLRSLDSPVYERTGLWMPGLRDIRVGSREHAPEALAMARKIDRNSNAGGLLASFISGASERWDLSALDEVLALAELRYSASEEWYDRYCTADNVLLFVERLSVLTRDQVNHVLKVARRAEISVDQAVVRNWLLEEFREESSLGHAGYLFRAMRIVAADSSAESIEFTRRLLLEFIPLAEEHWHERMIKALKPPLSADSEAIRIALREWLTSDAYPIESAAVAAAFLIDVGDEKAMPLFAEAYAKNRNPQVTSNLRARISRVQSGPRQMGYTSQQWGEILSSCLENGDPVAWGELKGFSCATLPVEILDPILVNLHTAEPGITREVLASLDWIQREGGSSPEIQNALASFLESEDKEAKLSAAGAVVSFSVSKQEAAEAIYPLLRDSDRYVLNAAIRALHSLRVPESAEKLSVALSHEDQQIRYAAVTAISQISRDQTVEFLLPLVSDPNPDVKKAVVLALERSCDQKAIPALLEALKDPYVADEARSAIEAIRFYSSEKEHWRRLQEGSGLNSETAAESLVKQAREDGSKAIRLAAIESLGTLAKPETLPLLIELMKSEDEELAAAASAAVNKINSK